MPPPATGCNFHRACGTLDRVSSDPVIELQCEAAELRDQVVFYDSRCQELESQLRETQDRLAHAEAEIARLEDRLDELLGQAPRQTGEEELRVMAASLARAQEELARERHRADELAALLQHGEQRYDEIVNELDEVYDTLEETHRKELEQVQLNLDRLRQLEQVMNEKLQERDQAIDELIQGSQRQAETFEGRIHLLEDENAALKTKLETVRAELAAQLPEELRKQAEQAQAEHRMERQALEQKVADLARIVELQKQDIERLQATAEAKARALAERDVEVRRLREQEEVREGELASLREALRAAKEREADAAEGATSELAKALEARSAEAKEARDRAAALEKEAATLRSDLKAARAARVKAEEESEQYRIRAEEFRRRLQKAGSVEEAQKASEQLRVERDLLKAKLAELEARSADLEARYAEAECALADQQAAARKEREQAEAQKAELRARVSSLEAEVGERIRAAEVSEKIEAERSEHLSRIASLEGRLQELQAELAAAKGRAEAHGTALRAASAREQQLRETRKELQQLQAKTEGLQLELTAQQKELASRDEQIKELAAELKRAREERKEAEDKAEARLEEQQRRFEEQVAAAREAAEGARLEAVKAELEELRRKQAGLEEAKRREEALGRNLKESQERVKALEASVSDLEAILIKQKEGYEKQIAEVQAELQIAREAASKVQAVAPSPAQLDAIRSRLEEVVKERAALQAQVKTQNETFLEFKARVENIQKLIRLKDDRIAELERRLAEKEEEDRKAARQTIRRIKTKLAIRTPDEGEGGVEGNKGWASVTAKERKEQEIERLMDQVQHGRSEFEERFRQLQEKALTGPKRDWPELPKSEERLKHEVQQITKREGHHTKLEGYELFISRAGIFGAFARKDIALDLLGVSEDGLRACVNDRVMEGDRLQVRITVKKFGDTIDAQADVVWCREVDFKTRFDVELRWSKIRDEDRRKVLRWIDYFVSLGKPPGLGK